MKSLQTDPLLLYISRKRLLLKIFSEDETIVTPTCPLRTGGYPPYYREGPKKRPRFVINVNYQDGFWAKFSSSVEP